MRRFKIAFKSALTCGVFVILQGSIYSCKKTVSNPAAETKVVNKIATMATSTSTVTINYTSQLNGNGSPLLFGGSNEPSQAHYASVYPQLQNAGIKFQRGTLHVDRLFATNFANITLADYQNNVNNVQESQSLGLVSTRDLAGKKDHSSINPINWRGSAYILNNKSIIIKEKQIDYTILKKRSSKYFFTLHQ